MVQRSTSPMRLAIMGPIRLRIPWLVLFLFALVAPVDAACAIASTRTSGIAPCAVQFDALATTMPASTRPFHDVDYRWDFGDAASGTWSTTGRDRNAAYGPVAAHVFLTGGTYTVTCTARDAAGNTSSASTTITVTAADVAYAGSTTRCISRVGDFNGAPTGSNCVTSTDLTSHIAWLNAASGRRLLLRAGETWTYPSTFDGYAITAAHSTIGAFGAGHAPTFNLQAQSPYSPLFLAGANDIRIIGLTIIGSGSGARGLQCTTGGEDMLIMGCEVTNVDMALVTEIDRSYLFDNYVHDVISYGLYMGGSRCAVQGNRIEHITGYHNMRFVSLDQTTVGENEVRWNGQGYHCIKLHAQDFTSSGPYSEQIVIAGNIIQGTSGLVIAPENSTRDERVRDVLVERNTIIGTAGDTWLTYIAAVSITFRNNIVDSSSQNGNTEAFQVTPRGIEPPPDHVEAYNNVFIKLGNSDTAYHPISFSGSSNCAVRNNIIHCSTFTGTLQTGWDIGSQGVSSNNLVYFPKTPSLCDDGTGAHVATDPLFASVDPTSADYLTLLLASPAIDRGHAGTTALRDYAGTARPQGSAPDLGIYEYTADIAGPTITAFTPTTGPVGTVVTITGTGFTGVTGVSFHGSAASYTVTNANRITATVPAGATTGAIAISTPGGTATSATPFTVTTIVAPTITAITPTRGPVGTTVTITGSSLSGATGVAFHGSAATYTVASATQITTNVPSGATSGTITVTTAGGTAASASTFTVTVAPTITAFTPSHGLAGQSVVITGTGFTAATEVAFSGTATVFTVTSAAQITAAVPAGAVNGLITVTTPDGTATGSVPFMVDGSGTGTVFSVADGSGPRCGLGGAAALIGCAMLLGLRQRNRLPLSR